MVRDWLNDGSTKAINASVWWYHGRHTLNAATHFVLCIVPSSQIFLRRKQKCGCTDLWVVNLSPWFLVISWLATLLNYSCIGGLTENIFSRNSSGIFFKIAFDPYVETAFDSQLDSQLKCFTNSSTTTTRFWIAYKLYHWFLSSGILRLTRFRKHQFYFPHMIWVGRRRQALSTSLNDCCL